MAQADIHAGKVDNTATAALDQTKPAPDDESMILPQNAALEIVKPTNGEDSATIPVGTLITWTYAVTNTGNVALTNIVVTDDKYTDPIGTIASLASSASKTLTKAGTAVSGPCANTGTATPSTAEQRSPLTMAAATSGPTRRSP